MSATNAAELAGAAPSSNEVNTKPQRDASGAPLNDTFLRHCQADAPVQKASAVESSHTSQVECTLSCVVILQKSLISVY